VTSQIPWLAVCQLWQAVRGGPDRFAGLLPWPALNDILRRHRLQTPRLGSELDHLDFSFVSATNLHSKAAPHMRRVTMTISDRDHYSEQWVETGNGKETVFTLNFVRR